MTGIGSSMVSPPRYRHMPPRPRSEGKRARIIDAAMRHFAEQGYHAARVGDIAAGLGIAKGSIFQHFGSKDGLFFEVYKKAVRSFPRYLDAPADVRERGFFDVLRYWLVSTEHLLHEDWIPYRVSLLGNYGTDLTLKREINRFLLAEDPYGTVPFVRYGLERGAFPGCTAYRGTRSRPLPPSGIHHGEEGSARRSVSGCAAAGDRRGPQELVFEHRPKDNAHDHANLGRGNSLSLRRSRSPHRCIHHS